MDFPAGRRRLRQFIDSRRFSRKSRRAIVHVSECIELPEYYLSVSSSYSRRRRRLQGSSHLSASVSDGNLVVSPSDSQKRSDQISVITQPKNTHKDPQPNMESKHPAQDVDNLTPLENTPPHGPQPEEIEGSTVPISAAHQTVGVVPPNDKDVSPNIEEQVHRVKIEPDRTGWGRISDLLRQYDRDRVEDVKEDIDTLLVFAGLFSAVITAFIIESYKTLQQQPEDTTNQILLQLSAQLASLTLSGSFVNSTIPAFTSPSFTPTRFSVLINTVWLLSLVFALITASVGILVKQWLHELMARDTQDPRQQVKIRFFREVGVQRWQVFEIAAALPLLLQLALLLFFVGLSAFLYDLNPVVTWIVTGVMIVWLIFYLFASIAPAFSSQCPYKTPILKGILHQVRVGSHTLIRSLVHSLHDHIPITWPTIVQRCEALRDWSDTWLAAWVAHEETEVRKDVTWDLPTLVCSREILQGEQLEQTITDCFKNCFLPLLLPCMKLLSRGAGPDVQRVLPYIPQGYAQPVFELFTALMDTLVRPSDHVQTRAIWYIVSTFALSNRYDPVINFPIPQVSLPMLVRLINENPESAVYSILTMYSVRHNTLENRPESVDNLFSFVSHNEKTYNIGAQFVSNLVAATRAICHRLWNQPQVDSDVDMQDILYWINLARSNSDPPIPIDPIALISTFSQVLYFLTPPAVRREHRDILIGVMGELASIVIDTDGSSWSHSRRYCVQKIHEFFCDMGLTDEHLVPKIGGLIGTWMSDFDRNRLS
ncbi:hypothetical protein QCA50_002585 [Cerrena zonata]|uniref:DUF6535 domain-containing protein n=1 Tax=Cerrena zonata TaxID=2478898 RepID=A0AAW0GPQ3_9APHY